MVPGLNPLPLGLAVDHVTALLYEPVPATTAENCTLVPIVPELGETVIEVIEGVTGGGVELPPALPPHAVINRPNQIPNRVAIIDGNLFISSLRWTYRQTSKE